MDPPHGQIPFTPNAKTVMELSLREALALGHNYIGSEHLLLGLVRADTTGTALLRDAGVDPDGIKQEIFRLVSRSRGGEPGRTRELPSTVPSPIEPNVWVAHLVNGIEDAIHQLLADERPEEAAELRTQQRALVRAVAMAQSALREAGVSASAVGEAARWQYGVETLEGEPTTWPSQLTRWRRDGWELLTVVPDNGTHQALLERRV
jgi:ATP-dependent Clp protease ATP-binding subunit ClpA